MTVALITSIERFVGLSTDTKPTGPRAGSLFYETDTGAQYLYDGAAWQLYLVGGPFRASKTIAFTGAANLGAIGNVPLFTVTGEVLIVSVVPFCTEDLAGATATLALGVTGSTALFIAATTATDIDLGDFWVDTVPDPNGVALPAAVKDIAITDNIVGTVAVAAITDGTIRLDCYWRPLSANGLVVPA